jgi:hypothetical protein
MTEHSTRLRIAAAALACAATPGAVLAAQASDPPKSVAAPITSGGGAFQAPAPKATRYCVIDTATGTRVPRKVCDTREAWLNRGFDPLKPDRP